MIRFTNKLPPVLISQGSPVMKDIASKEVSCPPPPEDLRFCVFHGIKMKFPSPSPPELYNAPGTTPGAKENPSQRKVSELNTSLFFYQQINRSLQRGFNLNID